MLLLQVIPGVGFGPSEINLSLCLPTSSVKRVRNNLIAWLVMKMRPRPRFDTKIPALAEPDRRRKRVVSLALSFSSAWPCEFFFKAH